MPRPSSLIIIDLLDSLKPHWKLALEMSRTIRAPLVEGSNNDAAIVRSTINLAHGLGLKGSAEGVGNADVWNRWVALGCELGLRVPRYPAVAGSGDDAMIVRIAMRLGNSTVKVKYASFKPNPRYASRRPFHRLLGREKCGPFRWSIKRKDSET